MKNKGLKISQSFQRWLLVLVAIAFFTSTAFLWFSQTKLSEDNTYNLLKLNISDVQQDIKDLSDENRRILCPARGILVLSDGIHRRQEDGRDAGRCIPARSGGKKTACPAGILFEIAGFPAKRAFLRLVPGPQFCQGIRCDP